MNVERYMTITTTLAHAAAGSGLVSAAVSLSGDDSVLVHIPVLLFGGTLIIMLAIARFVIKATP